MTMNNTLKTVIILTTLTLIWACKEKSHDHDMHDHTHDAADAVEVSENQVLYNEVMKIHDEVMPKMQDLHNRKQALKEKLTSATAEQKKAIELQISKLDSAEESMMDWMHEFNPIPDSAGEEKAREYLEGEIEKMKRVRENMLNALKETEQQ
jgi:hypothetical protein